VKFVSKFKCFVNTDTKDTDHTDIYLCECKLKETCLALKYIVLYLVY